MRVTFSFDEDFSTPKKIARLFFAGQMVNAVETRATTIHGFLLEVAARNPQFSAVLLDGDTLRPFLALFLNERELNDSLQVELKPNDRIHLSVAVKKTAAQEKVEARKEEKSKVIIVKVSGNAENTPALKEIFLGNQEEIQLESATTIRDALELLCARSGNLELWNDGKIRRILNVYLNGKDVRLFPSGLETPVKAGDEICIVSALCDLFLEVVARDLAKRSS